MSELKGEEVTLVVIDENPDRPKDLFDKVDPKPIDYHKFSLVTLLAYDDILLTDADDV